MNDQSYSLRGACHMIIWTSRLLQDDFDPAFALLSEHVTAADTGVRLGAIMGLGLAYASTRREDVSPRSWTHATACWWRELIGTLTR
jgi:26S proteasome regulatory subunit N1